MAGLAGRILYLWENSSLTFGELKEILTSISNNSLSLHEKVDGYNCFFSKRNGTPVMARNMKDVSNGGLSMMELSNREFKGGQNVKMVFIEALKLFAQDASFLENSIFLTENKEQVFYNFEIVNSSTKRLFEYDRSGLVLHGSGHFVIREGKRKFVNNNFNTNEHIKHIKTNLPMKLTEQVAPTALPEIDKLLENNSFTDFNKLSDLSNPKPLREILRNFELKVINSLKSSFVINEHESIRTFKTKIQGAIAELLESKKPELVEKTLKLLQEFPKMDDVQTCIEGVVFSHNNQMYKLNGYYGPINQLYSLYLNEIKKEFINEYDMGMMVPLSQKQYSMDRFMTAPDKKTLAVYPGSFKPPHAGHWNAFIELVEEIDPEGYAVNNSVVILISQKARLAHSDASTVYVSAEQSKALWELYVVAADITERVQIRIAEHDTPIKDIYDILLNEMAPDEKLVLLKSKKDGDDSRFNSFQQFSKKNDLGVDVEIKDCNVYSAGVSASNMRNWIAEGNDQLFKNFLPDHLNEDHQEQAWQIVADGAEATMNESSAFFLKSPTR